MGDYDEPEGGGEKLALGPREAEDGLGVEKEDGHDPGVARVGHPVEAGVLQQSRIGAPLPEFLHWHHSWVAQELNHQDASVGHPVDILVSMVYPQLSQFEIINCFDLEPQSCK